VEGLEERVQRLEKELADLKQRHNNQGVRVTELVRG
jgi:hypothetical protein